MKTTRKILACLMVVVMLASMFCAGAVDITIDNASEGTHNVYKIFDMEYIDSVVGYAAKVTDGDDWYDFVTSSTYAQSKVTLVAHPSIDDTFYVFWNDTNDAALANLAQTYVNAKGLTATESVNVTSSQNAAEFTGLAAGYYLVLSPESASPALFRAYEDKTINEKVSTVPNITKTINDDVVDIGTEVTYTIKVGVEAIATADYVISNTLATGVVFVPGSVTVSPPSGTWTDGADYTISGTTVTIDKDSITTLATNAKITITYKATVTNAAAINFANTNTALLTYAGGDEDAAVSVWTGKFNFNKKYDATNHLAGAGFKVTKDGTNFAKLTESGEVYTFNGWDTEANADEIMTAGSTITVQGLDEGNYTLIETTVPAGYVKLDADHIAPITATRDGSGTVTALSDETINITNTKGNELPETGGIGTTVFYAAGGILVLGALVVLLMKKRTVAE